MPVKSSSVIAGLQQQRSTGLLECVHLSLKAPIKTRATQEARYIMWRPPDSYVAAVIHYVAAAR